MDTDDLGYTSVLAAAGHPKIESLLWLLSQDKFEIDLRYVSPNGYTAAALIAMREDFSYDLLILILRNGIPINAPCVERWRFKFEFRPKPPQIEGNFVTPGLEESS